MWEGGLRVPAIAHWPGIIEPGSISAEPINSMDLFTTFIDLAGGQVPADRYIDGKNIKRILLPGQVPPSSPIHDIMFFFCDDLLMAVRYKQLKIYHRVFPVASEEQMDQLCNNGVPRIDYYFAETCLESIKLDWPLIFNVEEDPGEDHPLDPEEYALEVAEADRLLVDYRQTLPKNPQRLFNAWDVQTSVGPCCNPPYCFCNYPSQ